MPNMFIHTDHIKQYKTKYIKDEIHIVKLGENRPFDHKLTPACNFNCNVPISIGYRNSFYVIEAPQELIDDCGFIRVCISYEAYV